MRAIQALSAALSGREWTLTSKHDHRGHHIVVQEVKDLLDAVVAEGSIADVFYDIRHRAYVVLIELGQTILAAWSSQDGWLTLYSPSQETLESLEENALWVSPAEFQALHARVRRGEPVALSPSVREYLRAQRRW